MPVRKMRVEIYDEIGNRYVISFNGHITRNKVIHLFDLIELLGGIPEQNNVLKPSYKSKFDKVYLIVEKHFPIVWFSSKDIKSIYEKEFKEPIKLSTISTYLSRMVYRGLLLKSGSRNNRCYRIKNEINKFTNISY